MTQCYRLELTEEEMKFLREILESPQLTVPVKLAAVPTRVYKLVMDAKPTDVARDHAES